MPPLPAIELPVEYDVTQVEPLGPFRWVLLETLRTFPAGRRPAPSQLAARLGLGEAVFLDAAWASLVAVAAVDRDDFAQAGLTMRGEACFAAGEIAVRESETRTVRCLLAAVDGREIVADDAERIDLRALRQKPAWAAQLTADVLPRMIALQRPQHALRADERILRFAIDWASAREVRVQPGRPASG